MSIRPADNESHGQQTDALHDQSHNVDQPIRHGDSNSQNGDLTEAFLEYSEELDPELILSHVLSAPSLTQYWVRHCEDSRESVSAYFRCAFAPGQQRYILHVPFYPHFDSIPQVTAVLFEDIAGRVRITDQQKFGTRIEVILETPAAMSQSIMVEVTAIAELST